MQQQRDWVQGTDQRIEQQRQQQAAAAAAAAVAAATAAARQRRLAASAQAEEEEDEHEEAAAEVFSNYGASSLHRSCARMGIRVRGRVHPGDISEAASLR